MGLFSWNFLTLIAFCLLVTKVDKSFIFTILTSFNRCSNGEGMNFTGSTYMTAGEKDYLLSVDVLWTKQEINDKKFQRKNILLAIKDWKLFDFYKNLVWNFQLHFTPIKYLEFDALYFIFATTKEFNVKIQTTRIKHVEQSG